MNYNKVGRLPQVGGLGFTYYGWGEIVHSSGLVNFNNRHYNCNLGQGQGNNYGNQTI